MSAPPPPGMVRWTASPDGVTPGVRGDPVPVGQLVDATRYRRGVAVSDAGDQLGRPAVDLGSNGMGIGEVAAGEPVDRARQDDVGVDHVVGSAVG